MIDIKEASNLLKLSIQEGDLQKLSSLIANITEESRQILVTEAMLYADPYNNSALVAESCWEFEVHEPWEQKPSPLELRAIWKKMEACYRLCLKHGALVDARREDGSTILHMLAGYDEAVNIMRILLKHGADPNICAHDGSSPLQQSSRYSGEDTIALLLLDNHADPNLGDEYGPPIIVAASNGCMVLLKRLISAGADLNIQDCHGRTAITNALRWNCNPLPTISLLLEAGAEILCPDSIGFTPEDYSLTAALSGHDTSSVVPFNSSYFDLCSSARDGDSARLSRLLNKSYPHHILTNALVMASSKGATSCCSLLIDAGGDTNGINLYGISPISAASNRLHPQTIELLTNSGANPNLRNEMMQTSIYEICQLAYCRWVEGQDRNVEIEIFNRSRCYTVKTLCEVGADINASDNTGRTPLWVALMFSDDLGFIDLLISLGAILPNDHVGVASLMDYLRDYRTPTLLNKIRKLSSSDIDII